MIAADKDVQKVPEPEKKERPPIGAIILSLLAFWALIHSIKTRTADDFLKYSIYIAAPLAVIFFVVIVVTVIKSNNRRKALKDVPWMLVAMVVGLPFVGAIYYGVGAAIKDAYFWTRSPDATGYLAVVITIVITLGLGMALFYFRLHMRSFYGLTEAMIGLFIAGNKIASSNIADEIHKSQFYLAILTAGVYLVVRGLDNIHQGLTKEPFDRYGLKFLTAFKINIFNVKEKSTRSEEQ